MLQPGRSALDKTQRLSKPKSASLPTTLTHDSKKATRESVGREQGWCLRDTLALPPHQEVRREDARRDVRTENAIYCTEDPVVTNNAPLLSVMFPINLLLVAGDTPVPPLATPVALFTKTLLFRRAVAPATILIPVPSFANMLSVTLTCPVFAVFIPNEPHSENVVLRTVTTLLAATERPVGTLSISPLVTTTATLFPLVVVALMADPAHSRIDVSCIVALPLVPKEMLMPFEPKLKMSHCWTCREFPAR